MIFDLSGKEKSALLGAAEIALELMGEVVEAPRVPRPESAYLKTDGDIRPEVTPFPSYARHEKAPGFRIKSPPQPKKKALPVPQGVKFVYYGRPGPGVVTVAWIEASPGTIVMGFSFCSPKDRWCKATGRNMAMTRLYKKPLVIPCLYSPKRTVHEVVRAMLTHDFVRIAALAPGVTMFATVPSWTRGLGKRMGTRRVSGISKFIPFLIPTPLTIIARMMADIAKLGND